MEKRSASDGSSKMEASCLRKKAGLAELQRRKTFWLSCREGALRLLRFASVSHAKGATPLVLKRFSVRSLRAI